MKRAPLLLLTFALWLLPEGAYAAPRLSARLLPAKGVQTGQSLELRLRVEGLVPADRVVFSDIPASPGVDVLSRKQSTSDEGKTRVLSLKLLALAPGSRKLGPFRAELLKDSGEVFSLEAAALSFEVRSLLSSSSAGARPPPPPRSLMELNRPLLWGVGLALLALLAAFVLYRLWRRWKQRPDQSLPKAPEPPRSPWQWIGEALQRHAETLPAALAAGNTQAWVDELSDLLRRYLGQRYGFAALELTTDELVTKVSRLRQRAFTAQELASFLHDCDLVKFARSAPPASFYETLLERARSFVARTLPREVEGGAQSLASTSSMPEEGGA